MKLQINDTLWGIWSVWYRYFLIFKKDLGYSITTTFVEPILFIFAFGYGLGTMIGTLNFDGITITYRQFVLTGLVGQTLLFQGFFNSSYGSYFRIYYQKVFQTIAITPITLSEILWGELFWDATQGLISAFMVLLIGSIIGDFNPLGALAALPLCFIGALIFSGIGLFITGIARTINQISYPQYLLVMPMFFFCGVFYPIEQMPTIVQYIAWALPLTSIISLIRTFTLGFPLELQAIPLTIIWATLLVYFSRRVVTKRLVN